MQLRKLHSVTLTYFLKFKYSNRNLSDVVDAHSRLKYKWLPSCFCRYVSTWGSDKRQCNFRVSIGHLPPHQPSLHAMCVRWTKCVRIVALWRGHIIAKAAGRSIQFSLYCINGKVRPAALHMLQPRPAATFNIVDKIGFSWTQLQGTHLSIQQRITAARLLSSTRPRRICQNLFMRGSGSA